MFYYIESFYNRRRLYSALDYLSPEEYEQLYYQQQEVISCVGYLLHPRALQRRNQAFSLTDSGFLGNTLPVEDCTG